MNQEKKEIVIALLVIFAMAILLTIIFNLLGTSEKEEKAALKYCQDQGYNYNYCMKGIYGN